MNSYSVSAFAKKYKISRFELRMLEEQGKLVPKYNLRNNHKVYTDDHAEQYLRLTGKSDNKHVLLVIDLQQEFIGKNKIKYDKVIDYIKVNRSKYEYVFATKFISGNKNFKKYLNWELNSCSDLKFKADRVIEKKGYGLDSYRVLPKEYEYYIVGCETDACVYKIAMDLFDRGYKFKVIKDLCFTNSEISDYTLNSLFVRNLNCFI